MSRNFQQIWESIAQNIKEGIMSGKLKPGQRLLVSELAATHGVSNTPIREAFRHLASEGFVQSIPRKKVIVKQITPKEIEDIYMIQVVLEGLAARLAVKNSNENDLEKLEDFQRRMEKYYNEGNLEKFVKANQEFHQCFINASNNEKLIQLVGNIRDQIQRFRSILLRYPGRGEESLKEHKRILDAFVAHHEDLCENLVRAHIQNAAELLKKIIKQDNYMTKSTNLIL